MRSPCNSGISISEQFGASIPSSGFAADEAELLERIGQHTTVLMVGIVQERKGYAQTPEAFETLWANGSGLNLVIVGKEGWFAGGFIRHLRHHQELGKRLFWLETASDEVLLKLYGCASVSGGVRGRRIRAADC